MLDNSKYKATHDKIIAYVKHQIGIDLNDYRDGNGESPYTTTFWDLNGPMVCVNWCGSTGGMSESIQNRIMSLTTKGNLIAEWGGAWFKYIGLKGGDVSD